MPDQRQNDPLLQGTIQRTVQIPGASERSFIVDDRQPAGNLADLIGNAYKDVSDIGAGIGVLGSLGFARLEEAKRGYPIVRDTDMGDTLTAFDNSLQQIKSTYIDAPMKGDFGVPIEYAAKHPVNFALDLMPGVGAVGKIGRTATEIPAIAKPLAVVSNKAKSAMSLLDTTAQKAVPFYSAIREENAARQAISSAVQSFNNQFLDEATNNLAAAREAYTKIPKKYRDRVIEAGELRNPDWHSELSQIPEVVDFWQKANIVNSKMSGALQAAGALTEDEILIAKYGPYTKATTGLLEHELWTEEGLGAVRKAKLDMDAAGIEPTYFGIMTLPQVRAALRLRGSMFGSAPKLAERSARQSLDGPITSKPGWARTRQKGDFRQKGKQDLDAMRVLEARYLQGLQFLKMRDMLLSIIDNPNVQRTVGSGTKEFKLHDFMIESARGAGLPEQAAMQLINDLPEVINLPSRVADALKSALPQGTAIGDAMHVLLNPTNVVFKNMTLGFNPAWAVLQTAQNNLIAMWAMFRGPSPREIAASFMAYRLAFDKRVRATLPPHWFGEMSGERIAEVGEGALAQAVAKATAPAMWYMQKVFGIASEGDNYFRAVLGIYSLLREMDALEPAAKGLMRDAFNLQAQVSRLNSATPGMIEKATRNVERWFGKYDSLTAQQQKVMRSLFPFYLWWMHAFSLMKAQITETPIKTAIGKELMRNVPLLTQRDKDQAESYKRMGFVRIHDAQGNTVKGQNNLPLAVSKPGATPFSQMPELAQQIAAWTGATNEREGLPPSSPLIGFFLGWLGKINPQSGSAWSNPHLARSMGRQFRDPKEPAQPIPNLAQLAARSVMPSQEAQLRAILAYPNQPSDFTGLRPDALSTLMQGKPGEVFDAAYKLDNKLRAMKALPPAEWIFGQATGVRPTEERMSRKEEKRMNKLLEAKRKRALARQRKRSTRDATSIEKLLGG